ncbi:MAG: hypothetical protein ACTSX6_03190 [Candidatus Heimdallarchaeaceae archaeon]
MKNPENLEFDALEHPSTLKLFLFAKSVYPNDFGVREAKRKLDFNSPSTVLWHLDKLVEVNLLDKLETNRYILNKKGLGVKEITVPIKFSTQIIKGELVPRKLFLLSFIFSAFLVTIIISFFNPLIASISGIVFLGINCVLYLLSYLSIKRQLNYYSWKKEEEELIKN